MILISNVEKWIVPHIKSLGKIHNLHKLKASDFDLFSSDSPLIIGFENITDFSEAGLLADMLHLAVKIGKLRKIVYLSTYSVYLPKDCEYKEDDVIFPMNSIGARTAILEDILMYFSQRYEIDITILRIFNSYGPFQLPPYLIPTLLEYAVRDNTIRIGDLEKVRDFIYITDVVRVIEMILKSKSERLRIFNIGTGKATSVKELLNMVKKITNKDFEVIFDATRLREEYDYDYVVADITKVKEELGWKPQVDLETGLNLTYQWILGRSGKYV